MADVHKNSLPQVRVQNVSLYFRQVKALSDVSFEVSRGQIFGVIGSDGAGKSSMLRLMAGMLKPSSGDIFIEGLHNVRMRQKIKSFIGYMPQRFGLYRDLTVEENIDFFMDVFGIARAERKIRKEKYLGFSSLLPFVNRPAGNLSGGMKQKLGLACVLAHEPKLLILDEPTNGVDPVSRGEFWDILAQMRKEGMTLIVSTAYLDEGEKCDSLALMHGGVILETASPAIMKSGHRTLEASVIARIQEVDRELADDAFSL